MTMARRHPRDRKETHELVRKWTADAERLTRRGRKRQRRVLRRVLRAAALIILTTLVIVPGLIGAAVAIGRGSVGLFASPVVLVLVWALILYVMFGRKRARPKLAPRSDIAQLPANTEEWLDEQRRRLPATAQSPLDSLTAQLEALTPQLQGLDPEGAAAQEVKRLLSDELPELVNGYQKVPRALAQQPLYGGATPEHRLLEGLETINTQIARLQERLAAEDLKALATHQRYLDLKYNRKDELE
jgi:hypothetical protein